MQGYTPLSNSSEPLSNAKKLDNPIVINHVKVHSHNLVPYFYQISLYQRIRKFLGLSYADNIEEAAKKAKRLHDSLYK